MTAIKVMLPAVTTDKNKKRKKRDQDETTEEAEMSPTKSETKQKRKSKNKNKNKNKDKEDHEGDDDAVEKEVENTQDNTTITDTHTNTSEKQSRREQRKALLEQIPKVDKDGIAYTKLQLRRMTKRLQKGLPLIPTPQEEHENKLNEIQLRKEEELELAGMLYNKNKETGRESDSEQEEMDDNEEDNEFNDNHQEDQDTPTPLFTEETPFVPSKTNPQPPSKKTKRSKPVPPDYTCMACSVKASHWIYDCPNKVTKRGTNLVAKKMRGIHTPDDKKVFVSGLPFEMTKRQVEALFLESNCGTIAHCKLVTFADTGRCKGQAYITFDTEDGAKKALRMTGQVLANEPVTNHKKKKQTTEQVAPPKELKLKVTKVLNRIQTKGTSASGK